MRDDPEVAKVISDSQSAGRRGGTGVWDWIGWYDRFSFSAKVTGRGCTVLSLAL